MHRITLLIALIALAGLIGCFPNPRCNDDVRLRLLEDCKISFSPPTGLFCESRGTIEPEEAEALYRAYDERVCRIVDPGGDTDCLRTATCGQIETGECDDGVSIRQGPEDCVQACENAASVCYGSCDTSGPYERCADCGVNCIDQRQQCLEKC